MDSHPRYGLVVTAAEFRFEGRNFRAGEAIPDAIEFEHPRRITESIEAGKLRRTIITGSQIAQAMGEEQPAAERMTVPDLTASSAAVLRRERHQARRQHGRTQEPAEDDGGAGPGGGTQEPEREREGGDGDE